MEQRQLTFAHRIKMIRRLQKGRVGEPGTMTMEEALTTKLYDLFPELPEDLLMRIVPVYDEAAMAQCGSHLPWNRRKRRRLARAKQVIVHLFSGPDASYWEKALGNATTEVLCIDTLGNVPADLHDPMVYWFLLSLAASKKITAILAGPPCRTVSFGRRSTPMECQGCHMNNRRW